jgi:phospholipid/cholesterol/gamma-HCH transport system permease protein
MTAGAVTQSDAQPRHQRMLEDLVCLTGLAFAVLVAMLRPSTWRAPVREVLVRQVYFTGVQALGSIAWVAILVGLGVVLQTRLWLTEVGQSALLGPVLVVVVVRELAPLLVNLIVIVRSGSAIATELGSMSLHGEVQALDIQGVDPLHYLVVPRAAGAVISVMCLTVFFDLFAFATGYAASALMDLNPPHPFEFVHQVLQPLGTADIFAPVIKGVTLPLLVSVICAQAGLDLVRAPIAVPQAATSALARSVVTVVFVSLLITAVSYP